jgi:hypothetical protein
MTATQELPQADFARFWYVGKMLCIKRAAAFGYDIPISPWFKSTFQIDILSPAAHPERIWLYPPTMGLLAMVFSCIPLALSFWCFRFACLLLAALCLRRAGLGWLVIAGGLASPAEIVDTIGGQNGALTSGLLVSALLCFDTNPRFGGALAGLLCIKPQCAFVLPFILLTRRYSKALVSFLLVLCAVICLSILAEGGGAWRWFIAVAEPQSALILNAPLNKILPSGVTVLMMARSFHASLPLAWALQGVSSAVTAVFIWRQWKTPCNDPISRMALTMCLAVLLTPYGYLYDLVGFSIGMAGMFMKSPAPQKPVFAILWLFIGYAGTLASLTGIIVVPILAAIGAWLIWRQMAPGEAADVQSEPEGCGGTEGQHRQFQAILVGKMQAGGSEMPEDGIAEQRGQRGQRAQQIVSPRD